MASTPAEHITCF